MFLRNIKEENITRDGHKIKMKMEGTHQYLTKEFKK
jgi:hypothetical protein